MCPKKEKKEVEEKTEETEACDEKGVTYAYGIAKSLGQSDNMPLRRELEKAFTQSCETKELSEEEKEEEELEE